MPRTSFSLVANTAEIAVDSISGPSYNCKDVLMVQELR
jgi:hypothetical protein